jgi:hypothetical protein
LKGYNGLQLSFNNIARSKKKFVYQLVDLRHRGEPDQAEILVNLTDINPNTGGIEFLNDRLTTDEIINFINKPL